MFFTVNVGINEAATRCVPAFYYYLVDLAVIRFTIIILTGARNAQRL